MNKKDLKEIIREVIRGSRRSLLHKSHPAIDERGMGILFNGEEVPDEELSTYDDEMQQREDYVKSTSALHGGKNNMYIKGIDGKRLGNLFIGDDEDEHEVEELQEFSFTKDDLTVLTQDVIQFIKKEHTKLGKDDPLDSYKFIQQVINSPKVSTKFKGVK